MHKIKNNPSENDDAVNKEYVDSKEKTISWNDYQALSEEEKNNGTTYFIPDMPGTDNVGDVKFYTDIGQLGLSAGATIGDVFNALPSNSVFNSFVSKTNYPELPDQQGLLTITKTTTAGFNIIFKRSGSGSKTENSVYMGQLKGVDGTDLTWDRVCTTKVSNIKATLIQLDSKYFADAKAYYEVRNGECIINFMTGNFAADISKALVDVTIATGLPKPTVSQAPHTFIPWAGVSGSVQQVVMFVDNKGNLRIHTTSNIANACIYTSFSYFVAES